MSMNVVDVIDAALFACSSPGIRSLSVFVACAIVCGLSSTMVRISSANRRRLSAMVVGAGACSVLSSGTGLTRFVANVLPSSSSTLAMAVNPRAGRTAIDGGVRLPPVPSEAAFYHLTTVVA